MARHRYGRDLIRRWEGNPAIRSEDLSFPCLDIKNAGAAMYANQTLLLVTIEGQDGHTRLYRATSENGYHFRVDTEPLLAPSEAEPFRRYEERGVGDPRITFLDDWYYIVYTADSHYGNRLALARTKDFVSVERLGFVSQPDTKHGALFPEKLGGRYCRLERPREGGAIWLSYSDDLVYWGDMQFVMCARGGFWDFHRIGPGAPPIRVEEGWLVIYYGVKETSGGPLFRLGGAILDAEKPDEVIGRTDVPLLAPHTPYERVGDVNNLVFTCGAFVEKDQFKLYYGGSDSCICVGSAPLAEVVSQCMNGDR
jgi:beta-1,4-mannooligosaccharide/beta-1,4-mannosyl-N-acetylglucosamine phosphorylase